SATPASGSIVYSSWGLLLAVDSLSKKAYVKVVNRNLFISQLCVVGNVVGENYAITLPISVTDAKGNLKVVQIPIKVHADHAPNWLPFKNLTLPACVDGQEIATIRDQLDGGIKSFTIISAPGYVSGQNDLVVVLENGILVVKVGDEAQFLKFFRANFTMDYQAMTATYAMRIETVDAFEGKAETPLNLKVIFALPTVTVEWGTQKLMSKLANNTVLGEVSFTGPYDFVSASLTSPLSLAAFGIEVVANTTNRNAAIIRVADAVLLSKAAFEGRLRLNLNSINPAYFSLDMDLNVNLTQGQSRVVPTRLTLGATVLPQHEYYAQLVQPELNIEVEETLKSYNSTTVLDFDIRTLFPAPYEGTFDHAGLNSIRVTYSKPLVYVYRLTFKEAFFDPNITKINAMVSFTGSFKYGPAPKAGPITVKFNFYPKK
ncbi:MAG TPA: hypothetical protein VHS96_12815, partial [Bacteroidia bacterium]|nr:hypothetical protein [Bacteroidia bacterium]